MGLESSNRQSSLLSSSLPSHLRFLILFSSLIRVLGFCLGLWLFGSKPAEDGFALMDGCHGSGAMIRFGDVGPRLCWRRVDTLVFLVGQK